MKNQTPKQKRNAKILNVLKTLDYKPKERIYAPLIIEILEATNSFDKKLDNCVVEHTIMEQMLCYNHLGFIEGEFGRSESEVGSRFIEACENLMNIFNKNNPDGSGFVADTSELKYFTKEFNRERRFMQKLIWKIVEPLKLERVDQERFMHAFFTKGNKTTLYWSWRSGTKRGIGILDEQFELSRKGTIKEIKMIENEVQKLVCKDDYGIPYYEDVVEIIEKIVK